MRALQGLLLLYKLSHLRIEETLRSTRPHPVISVWLSALGTAVHPRQHLLQRRRRAAVKVVFHLKLGGAPRERRALLVLGMKAESGRLLTVVLRVQRSCRTDALLTTLTLAEELLLPA